MQSISDQLTASIVRRSITLGIETLATTEAKNHLLVKKQNSPTLPSSMANDTQAATMMRSTTSLGWALAKLVEFLRKLCPLFGYFKTQTTFCPWLYTANESGPQVVCYSIVPVERCSDVATIT
jgi:hypothetical protein